MRLGSLSYDSAAHVSTCRGAGLLLVYDFVRS